MLYVPLCSIRFVFLRVVCELVFSDPDSRGILEWSVSKLLRFHSYSWPRLTSFLISRPISRFILSDVKNCYILNWLRKWFIQLKEMIRGECSNFLRHLIKNGILVEKWGWTLIVAPNCMIWWFTKTKKYHNACNMQHAETPSYRTLKITFDSQAVIKRWFINIVLVLSGLFVIAIARVQRRSINLFAGPKEWNFPKAGLRSSC